MQLLFGVRGGGHYVQVDATAFDDSAGNSYVGIADETTWTFTSADETAPTVSSLSPTNGEEGVDVESNLVITFSENVDAESGDITLYDSNDTEIEAFDVTSDISGSGTETITINPTSDLTGSKTFYVQIDVTAFDDSSSNSYAGISDSATWTFSSQATARRAGVSVMPISVDQPVVDGDRSNEESSADQQVDRVNDVSETEQEVSNVEASEVEGTEGVTESTSKLVKIPGDSAVYKINPDGTRNVFIDEGHYSSYYEGFDNIEEVSAETLEDIPLLGPMTYSKGSLIKFLSVAKVYLVGDNNVLHWISNEFLFFQLGHRFNMVKDVLDSLFPLYTVGEDFSS